MRIAVFVAVAACAVPAVARSESGVDPQRKVVKCSGTGAANLRDAGGNPAVARIGAEKAAKLDALRNCLETLKGVELQSGQKLGAVLESDSALSARVEALVRGFQVVGKPRYFSDGSVELDVEVPVEGALSDVIFPKPPDPNAGPKVEPAAPSATKKESP